MKNVRISLASMSPLAELGAPFVALAVAVAVAPVVATASQSILARFAAGVSLVSSSTSIAATPGTGMCAAEAAGLSANR